VAGLERVKTEGDLILGGPLKKSGAGLRVKALGLRRKLATPLISQIYGQEILSYQRKVRGDVKGKPEQISETETKKENANARKRRVYLPKK